MSVTGSFARQGTFDAAPADSISGNSIKKGGIEIPVVRSDSETNAAKKNNQHEYNNVAPTSTHKPPKQDSHARHRVPGKNGALNSLNNKLSRGDSPDVNPDTEKKPRPTLSNSLSQRLKDSPRREPSPSKAAVDKSRKDVSDNPSTGKNRKTHKSSQVKSADDGIQITSTRRTSVPDSSLNKDNTPGKHRNRKLSPSRYEDVNISTSGVDQTRYEIMDNKDGFEQITTSRTISGDTVGGQHSSPNVPNPHRQPRAFPDSDHRESYEHILLERDGLLRAESAYKKRIKQLEDEAKLFTKDVTDLSAENKDLRARLESLDSNQTSREEEARQENRELLQRCEKLEGENQSLWTENGRLKSDKSEGERQVHKLTEELEKQRETSIITETKLKDDLLQASEKNKKLESEYYNLETSKSNLEERLKELESEKKVLTDTVSEKRREVEELLKALHTDTELRSELKQSQSELDRVQKCLNDITLELDQFQTKYTDLESQKTQLETVVKDQDSEIHNAKEAIRKKKTLIADLHSQVDALKKENERLKSENTDLRLLRKDISNLKEKLKNLGDELDRKSEGNKKLKRDMSEKNTVIGDLRQQLEGANASTQAEADKFREQLREEHQHKKKTTEEMDRKSTYISKLETETFEMNMKFDSLNEKVRELEREKREWESKRDRISEIEDSNRQFVEENRRLRQMLVERNMEVTNRKSEKTVLTSRLEKLERKQQDADVKVNQLQGWMDGLYHEPEPIVLVTTTSLPEPGRVKPKAKVKKLSVKRLQENHKATSLEDLRSQRDTVVPTPRTPPSLPAIEFKAQGYYDIYKHKLKLMKDRRF